MFSAYIEKYFKIMLTAIRIEYLENNRKISLA